MTFTAKPPRLTGEKFEYALLELPRTAGTAVLLAGEEAELKSFCDYSQCTVVVAVFELPGAPGQGLLTVAEPELANDLPKVRHSSSA
ncbi:hypothetical protein FRC07_013074 [Ceratobasidium sp. 392]|nr:hypothetical protein FRC07_013074 [Ceratobasidium sp. 392]